MVGSVEGEEDGTAVGAGDSEGLEVGDPVTVGRKLIVGESLSTSEGIMDSMSEGELVGTEVGALEVPKDGTFDGGKVVGRPEVESDGRPVDGTTEGASLGFGVGNSVGRFVVGKEVGWVNGAKAGDATGTVK